MSNNDLPISVYRLPQAKFGAIPGSPWVYWISPRIRDLFQTLPQLSSIALPRAGMHGGDKFRFARYWWEVGFQAIGFSRKSRDDLFSSGKKWVPYMKGGRLRRWYGNQDYVLAFDPPHYAILSDSGNKLPSRQYYFMEGVTWTEVASKRFTARISPGGFVFDAKGSSAFPQPDKIPFILAILNSRFGQYVLTLMNPTVSFQAGDIARIPLPRNSSELITSSINTLTRIEKFISTQLEETFDFIAPVSWQNGFQQNSVAYQRQVVLENHVDEEIYKLYGFDTDLKNVINDEVNGLQGEAENIDLDEEEMLETDDVDSRAGNSAEEMAARWVSYAVGIVLGRFVPGATESQEKRAKNSQRALGSAVYYRDDFAIGSLPAPDESEYNELVGAPDQFAYVDPQGGRHVFPAQVERALQSLRLEDGIAVLDAGHPRDLAMLVEKALILMLGEAGAGEVVAALSGETSQVQDFLRKFLAKDYFTAWHLSNRWYRKRPVYWPIQSAKRSYGFILFHEKITRDTFYTIQREPYLDTKRNAVALKIGDLQGTLAGATGGTRKRLEKELDDLQKLSTELDDFAKELEYITMGGYNPAPDWIDDGVILRMARLWKVIPIWKTEPKKYWDRLEAGDFDWSHIAMNYWSKRVRAKCKTNKSYAIAHGHEEWYEGK